MKQSIKRGLAGSISLCTLFLFIFHYAAAADDIELVRGQQKIIRVDSPQRIAIGDESIADVYLTDNRRQVLITGKGIGTTDLIIWDKHADKQTRKIIVREVDPQETAKEIRDLFREVEGVNVKVVGANVVLEGEVFNQADLQRLQEVMKSYPLVINLVRISPRLKQLIEIDVKVVEVDEEALQDFKPLSFGEGSIAGSISSDAAQFRWTITASDFLPRINAWITRGVAKILARPRLVTAEGKEASFLSGGEIPYQVSHGQSGFSIQWKEYGVSLKIKPTLDREGNVELFLYAQVSSPDYLHAVSGVPAIKTRWTKADVYLKPGQTIVIAGLLQQNVSEYVKRVPVLGYIPLLDFFFKETRKETKVSELMILVTPYIPAQIQTEDYKKLSQQDGQGGKD